jgi:iron complex outermembrane recepter protein
MKYQSLASKAAILTSRTPVSRWRPGVLWAPVLAAALATPALAEVAAAADLTELSLDDLMEIEVVSVSGRAEPLGLAAAAIHVITGEEIRRSGARSIAEALRLVPGMNVARTSADDYAISARGFQNTGDKLQVLMDGRSVYTPLTSAVFWDVLETDLGSIDRIEVIRGPGATVWGANAVNGVVNVITKSAADTRGGEFEFAAGSEERAAATLRAGTAVGDSGHARFYAKARERDAAATADGGAALDGQHLVQGGLRSDWELGSRQTLTVSGDLYSSHVPDAGIQSPQVETSASGANLNSRWAWTSATGSRVSATFSFDHYRRDIPETYREERDTYDAGLQHDFRAGRAHEISYGIGYRHSSDDTGGPPLAIIFSPPSRKLETFSAYAQDQIRLGERVIWTLGAKFEHNDFTGDEVQPGTRLGWVLAPEWFTWAAVSRAVRTPNRLDHDIAIYCPPPDGFPGLCEGDETLSIGSRDFDSEKLIAYEWGVRHARGEHWSADLAVFYNDYNDLRSTETGDDGLRLANELEGRGAGAELSLAWRPRSGFDALLSYSFLDLEIDAKPGSTDTSTAATIEGGSPRHQAGLRVYYRPHEKWTVDGFLRHVGRLAQTANPGAENTDTSVPAYTELNLRIAYRPLPQLELILRGENLLDDQHPEYGAADTRSELQRSVQIGFSWIWP